MENWGLITYREDFLLENRSQAIIAHEVAHQWFGNLVTCVRPYQLSVLFRFFLIMFYKTIN